MMEMSICRDVHRRGGGQRGGTAGNPSIGKSGIGRNFPMTAKNQGIQQNGSDMFPC